VNKYEDNIARCRRTFLRLWPDKLDELSRVFAVFVLRKLALDKIDSKPRLCERQGWNRGKHAAILQLLNESAVSHAMLDFNGDGSREGKHERVAKPLLRFRVVAQLSLCAGDVRVRNEHEQRQDREGIIHSETFS
jgi:hypothetical protein